MTDPVFNSEGECWCIEQVYIGLLSSPVFVLIGFFSDLKHGVWNKDRDSVHGTAIARVILSRSSDIYLVDCFRGKLLNDSCITYLKPENPQCSWMFFDVGIFIIM